MYTISLITMVEFFFKYAFLLFFYPLQPWKHINNSNSFTSIDFPHTFFIYTISFTYWCIRLFKHLFEVSIVHSFIHTFIHSCIHLSFSCIFSISHADKKVPRGLPSMEDEVVQIGPHVWRVMGLNPSSHTLQGSRVGTVQ